MLSSITYLEIRCRYNKSDLLRCSGALYGQNVQGTFTYRSREYSLKYDTNVGNFLIFNKYCDCIAIIEEDCVGFFLADAPEIGLNLIWGLLAQLCIYPVISL